MNERVFVGLGANLGDARRTIEQALRKLGAGPDIQLVGASPGGRASAAALRLARGGVAARTSCSSASRSSSLPR